MQGWTCTNGCITKKTSTRLSQLNAAASTRWLGYTRAWPVSYHITRILVAAIGVNIAGHSKTSCSTLLISWVMDWMAIQLVSRIFFLQRLAFFARSSNKIKLENHLRILSNLSISKCCCLPAVSFIGVPLDFRTGTGGSSQERSMEDLPPGWWITFEVLLPSPTK